MNSYLLNQVLEKARRLQPAQLSYDSTPKVVSVAVEKFVYEHKTYSNHRYEHRVAPDYLKMAPSHAKEAWSRGEVTIVDHGACDCFRFPNGLMAYKSWVSAGGGVSPGEPGDDLGARPVHEIRSPRHSGLGSVQIHFSQGAAIGGGRACGDLD